MWLLVADVEGELQARWTRGTLTPSQKTSSINAAIRAYGRLNPLRAFTTLRTVADVSEYRLPDDIEDVSDVIVTQRVSTGYEAPILHPREVSDIVIDHMIRDAITDEDEVRWGLRGRNLVLHPTPSVSNDDIEIYYTKGYSKDDSGAEWPGISSKHIDAVVKLALAELLSDELGRVSQLPDYRSGLISINRSKVANSLGLSILQLRREAAGIIGVPVSHSFAVQGSVG